MVYSLNIAVQNYYVTADFDKVTVTKGSGDQGVDILAQKTD